METARSLDRQAGPTLVVQLRRDDTEGRRFSLSFSDDEASMGFMADADDPADPDDLSEFGMVEGLAPWELGRVRIACLHPGASCLEIFALDPAALEAIAWFVPSFWYAVELTRVSAEDPRLIDLELPTDPLIEYEIEEEEEEEEPSPAPPPAQGALVFLPSGQCDVEQTPLTERDVNTVPRPLPGLNPLTQGWESERVIEELTNHVAWEREQRLLAEAEVARLQHLLRGRRRDRAD